MYWHFITIDAAYKKVLGNHFVDLKSTILNKSGGGRNKI